MSYDQLSILTGYSRRQLIRISKSLKEKGIDSTLIHGNKGLATNNRASNTEVDYIVNFKNYTLISLYHNLEIFILKMLFSIHLKSLMF